MDDRGTAITTVTGGEGRSAPLRPQEFYQPGDEGYDRARSAWNLAADLRPAAIWIAHDVEQVQAGLAHARRHGLKIAVQNTGHFGQALPPLDDTMLLKPLLHRGVVEVDPATRVARVLAGASSEQLVEAAAQYGLAFMHGSSPTVGVVGYLLNGGLSFYGRKYGLAANHVRAFEVVTPDGVFRRVDAEHDPELFFALRGGGGGYAVVCTVEIELLPYAEIVSGALFFSMSDARTVLRTWRDWTRSAPDTIMTTFRALHLPDLAYVPEPLRGRATVCVDAVALDPGEASVLEARLRAAAAPLTGGFTSMPSGALFAMRADPRDPLPSIGDGVLLDDLDDDAVGAFVRAIGPTSPLMLAELRQLGGALTAAPPAAGARGHLEGRFALLVIGVPDAPAPKAELDSYLDQVLADLAPWTASTRFSSFAERWTSLSTCLPADALARVGRTRVRYDPDEVLVAPQLPPRPPSV